MAAEQVYEEYASEVYAEYDEEEELVDREIWKPETEMREDPLVVTRALKNLPNVPRLTPSQFTGFAFYMPDEDGQGYSNFSFDGRRHMYRVYDTPARRVLLVCGRQVEKSTMLGNIAICYMSMVQAYRVLYVSPSATQTKTFSQDRIKEPIETSPILRHFTTNMLSSNIFEKQFVNRSKITLRYAFLNADRTRGIPAWALLLDEFQDIMSDNIPVIEQCLSHAPEQWKRYVYSGTPKSKDNNIEYYRERLSTQGEWVVPCDRCGSTAKSAAGRHWNILGEKNIGKNGLVCDKCHELIFAAHDDAQWARMVEEAPFESYRIPQLMVPWKPWPEILLDYERYPRDKFYNEVLGISYDSGLRPLTSEQIRVCCNQDVKLIDYENYRNLGFSQPIFAGIDWGTGEHAYTVIFLGTYVDMRFRIFYCHRFTGQEVDPQLQLDRIIELLKYFNVALIGCDYGGGFDRNDRLVREFGPKKVWKYQYIARPKKKIEWDPKLGRFKVHRTEVMSDILNAIKRSGRGPRLVEFPDWQEFKDPYAQDMLNIFSEYNNALKMIMYKNASDKPDDSFHSLLYCWLVSMIMIPRADILIPRKVDKRTGFPGSQYKGPVYQG